MNCSQSVVDITTAQLHSSKPESRFCAGSNPARGVMLNAFHRSTIPQKSIPHSSSTGNKSSIK